VSESKEAEEVEAVVSGVKGRKGNRYAVTFPSDKTLFEKGATVTFSLSQWKGEGDPQDGQLVKLSQIVRFSKGWRANSARPIAFSKEQKK
jgi:hypothetical protein